MRLHFTNDVDVYADRVLPFLERDPVRCTVSLTVIANVKSGITDAFTGSWVEDDAGAVIATASWTPPFDLLLSPMTPDAARVVAAGWAPRVGSFGGVIGPRVSAAACAQRLGESSGREPHEIMVERLFRIDAVIDPPRPEGGPLVATNADRAVAVEWFEAFAVEAGVTRGNDLDATFTPASSTDDFTFGQPTPARCPLSATPSVLRE
jgi:hypothetical protein